MPTNNQGITVQRQYIGARYIPKFFQGPDGTPAWVGNVPYEPLTIVTYLGNSYTSKIPVTPGIGNPAENPTYWALTGAYNQQVEEYRQEVAEVKQQTETNTQAIATETTNRENADAIMQNDINIIKSKIDTYPTWITSDTPTIFISDSYGQYPDAANNWISQTISLLGLTNAINYSFGSTGFAVTSNMHNFTEMIENVPVTDPLAIKRIIVGGGANDDLHATKDQIKAGIQNFMTAAKTRFPNASVIIAHIGFTTESSNNQNKSGREAYLESYLYGAIPVENIFYVMQNRTLLADTTHPTNNGSLMIAEKICEFLISNKCNVHHQIVTSYNSATITEILDNGEYSCAITFLNSAKSGQFNFGGESAYLLDSDIPLKLTIGSNSGNIGGLADVCIQNDSNVTVDAPMYLWIANSKLYLSQLISSDLRKAYNITGYYVSTFIMNGNVFTG